MKNVMICLATVAAVLLATASTNALLAGLCVVVGQLQGGGLTTPNAGAVQHAQQGSIPPPRRRLVFCAGLEQGPQLTGGQRSAPRQA